MSTSQQVQMQLKNIRLAYDAVQQLRARWEALQTVEQARAEYEVLVAEEERRLADLQKHKSELEIQKRRLTTRTREQEFIDPPSIPKRRGPIKQSISIPANSPVPTQVAARLQLKKLVNRWAYAWGMTASVQGQINRIADDLERPLGEALALLDWSVFADATRLRETPEAHLARLTEWEEALIVYRDRLAGEIDTQEIRFRRWLPIWECWRIRESSTEGKARWDTFIAETHRAKQAELERVQQHIDQLKAEVNRLLLR